MIEAKLGQLKIDDGWLHYEVGGNPQGETVVSSHAGFLDSRMFDPQWAAFSSRYRLIRYDMRGFGRSSAATGPICRRTDLRTLLDHLEVRRAHLLGCSMGGEIVLDLALETPERAASLTLIGATPSGFQPQGTMPRYLEEMIGAMQRGDLEQANELQTRIWFDGPFREPDQVDDILRQKALAMNRIPVENSTFLVADSQPRNPLQPSAMSRLADVPCPVLVIVGALDDPELLRAAELLAAGIPESRLSRIDGAAHVPSFEKPEKVNPLLDEFLRAATS
ncbi:MAG TPA: alpha/beta hydrolase [Spirochaetia bacterium]|nr:alpha/beta hydrolase [Spirochaetia bacterium]